jgi:hypothetical protein
MMSKISVGRARRDMVLCSVPSAVVLWRDRGCNYTDMLIQGLESYLLVITSKRASP